jgi:hypothetical protein
MPGVAGHIKDLAETGQQWVSYGIVEPDTDGQHSVRFNDENGAPLGHGVLVDVKLQPSGITVPCRVGNQCAGNGEGEWHPFGPGDEVMVLIPEGNERSGCVIVCRLNQSHDVFPTTVGGQDATTNTFGFKRHIVPFITEVGQSWIVRSFQTGAAMTLDPTGQILINDGDGSLLAMTPHAVSLMTAGQTAGFQIDLENNTVLIKAPGASLVLNNNGNSQWTSTGQLSISASGNPGLNNVATVQGVAQILAGFCTTLFTIFSSALIGPVLGAELAILFNPAGVAALLNGTFALAGTPACSFAPFIPGITAALSVPKVPGINAGVGSAGLLTD